MLAWLSILAYKNKGSEKLVTVEDIAMEHWKKFGRNFFRCTLSHLHRAVQYAGWSMGKYRDLPPASLTFCIPSAILLTSLASTLQCRSCRQCVWWCLQPL